MSIIETKIFTGGINTDQSLEAVKANEYIKAHNFRPGTTEQEEGYATSIESTTRITPVNQLHSGINTGIGTGEFKSIKKEYTVKFNSQGYHLITELDYETLQEKVIFTDLQDTGGVPVFDITPDNYFYDIKLLHDEYLLMTDGIGQIYCINLARLKSSGYGSVITKQDFNLLKPQPLIPIKAEYISDPNKNSNLTKGKLFQFRYQNEFYDNMKSAWSTISKRPVPELEMTDSVGDDPTKLNGILLTANIGDSRVQKLRFAFRAAEYDWYELPTKTREYILSLPAVIDIEEEIYEAYNPTTNEYSFIFYNDNVGDPISALDTDEPYDAIPHSAGTLEVVNGDIVALADLTEGYDRPVVDMDVSVTSYEADTGISLTDPRNFTVNAAQERISGTHRRLVSLDFYGIPKTGDRIVVNIGAIDSPDITSSINYVATSADNNNLDSFTLNLLNRLPDESYFSIVKRRQVYSPDHITVFFVTVSKDELKSAPLILNQTGDIEGKASSIVKAGSSYQLAVAYMDYYGQYFPIATGSDFVAPTPSYATTEGYIPQIGWSINSLPPAGAVSYQILISENTKYLKTLYITGMYDDTESKDDFIVINLGSLDRYVKDSNSGIVAYDYAEGDRVTFIHNFSGSATPIKWFNNPPLDFAVAGFEIKTKTVDGVLINQYLLKIKKSSLIDINADLLNKELLLEAYTPKKNNENLTSKIFYEIGEQYPIINGEHSVKSGVIKQADAYIKPRKFLSNVPNSNNVFAFNVEDFHFSDDYISNFWSKGRGRTYNDEVGKVRRKASIRYSDVFTVGSLNNNINRFYANRLYGDLGGETTSVYGAITKLIMRSQYLIATQELDIAHIPVYTSILEDQQEQANVAISDKLFNNVRYVGTRVGTGLSKRAITVSGNGTVYFIDPNNGYPCRDGYDGVKIININNEKYFIDKLKSVKPNEIVSYFDNFNNEWNITFLDLSVQPFVFKFDETQWEYKDDYETIPDGIILIQPSNGTAEIVGDNIVYTPDEDYEGSDSLSITFLDEFEQVVNKNACISITPGDVIPDDFSFIPLFDKEPSTLYTSNAVFPSGINIAVPISIVDGEYSINDGAFTSSPGMVSLGDKVVVRRLSSSSYNTTVGTTLTIGTKSATFTIETKEPIEAVSSLSSPKSLAGLWSRPEDKSTGCGVNIDQVRAGALDNSNMVNNTLGGITTRNFGDSSGIMCTIPSSGNYYFKINATGNMLGSFINSGVLWSAPLNFIAVIGGTTYQLAPVVPDRPEWHCPSQYVNSDDFGTGTGEGSNVPYNLNFELPSVALPAGDTVDIYFTIVIGNPTDNTNERNGDWTLNLNTCDIQIRKL